MSSKNGIRDNHDFGSAGGFLQDKIKQGSKLSIVSAYFTIYAYEKLQSELDTIEHLDFLFGDSNNVDKLNPKDTMMEFSIVGDKLEIPLEKRLQQRALARACSEWIMDKVDIRSLNSPDFAHGKMYHVEAANGVIDAMIGSSNFTVNGLGLGEKPNLELNLILADDRDKDDLKQWFANVWNKGEDKKALVLELLAKLYEDNPPEFIYYKTLFHLFSDFLDEQAEEKDVEKIVGLYDTKVWNILYDFQKDGVKGAINKINKFNGCIIADSVGLGKTFEALAIIKFYELRNHRILVLCPKRLSENWNFFKRNYKNNRLLEDKLNYDVLYHTDLTRNIGFSGDTDLTKVNWSNYDLVVIDESHNFRNSGKSKVDDKGREVLNRYAFLMQKILQEGVKTKVLMLSATPVNTYLKDIRNQFLLITHDADDYYKDLMGIESISNTMKTAQMEFTDWVEKRRDDSKISASDLMDKLNGAFFKMLDGLTIARSRKHIEKFYKKSDVGKFPTRKKPQNVYAEIAGPDEFFSYDELNDQILKFTLSIYQPSAYLKDEFKELYSKKEKVLEFNQESRERFLIGMMKINLLKRLESSVVSFSKTLIRIIEKIDNTLTKIDEYKKQINLNVQADITENLDEDVVDALEETSSSEWVVGKKLLIELKHIDIEKWEFALDNDKKQLQKIYDKAILITPEKDRKLKDLIKIVSEKLAHPINQIPDTNNANEQVPNKKMLIFTAFSDTAQYIYSHIKDNIQEKLNIEIALIGGSGNNQVTYHPAHYQKLTDYDRILTMFSPRSKNRSMDDSLPQEKEIDLLIATDCISEGQNLQDCDCMINYDIHWNPVRIIQRFGRIDRIGSFNKEISMVNFWPTKELEKYVKLKSRVETRMALVDLTATGEDNLLNAEKIEELIDERIGYREKQLKKLQEEILDLEDMNDSISLSDFSLDDFRRDLLQYLQANKEALEKAPLGMFSLVPTNEPDASQMTIFDRYSDVIKPGVIFCLKYNNDSKGAKAINPLHPYYMVYIREDGEIRYNFASTKQILEIYQSLCIGKQEPYQELVRLFESETKQGQDVREYSELLTKALVFIKRSFEQRNRLQLSDPEGLMLPKEERIVANNEFVLITWLIIK